MKNFNRGNVAQQEQYRRIRAARVLLSCCIELYELQHEEGRYLIHGHPFSAASWNQQGMMALVGMECAIKTRAHLCRHGRTQLPHEGSQLVRKPDGFLIDSLAAVVESIKRCDEAHQHATLEEGKARHVQIYPQELCNEICRGLKHQREMDAAGLFHAGAVHGVIEKALHDFRWRSRKSSIQTRIGSKFWMVCQGNRYDQSCSGKPGEKRSSKSSA